MENFKQLNKCDVWSHLQAGKKVYAVVLKSRNFNEKIYNLRKGWNVDNINIILSDKEKNVAFYEEADS